MHRSSSALLIIAAFAASAIAGCSRVATDAGGRADHAWTRPGVLRWGEYSEPDTLNPMLSSLQVTVEESMLWAGYLFEYDDRGELVPDLATEVPTVADGGISADGRSITYHLRRGVRWQDGAPFSADDVIFSWRAVMDPRNDVPSRGGYELVDRIDKVDDHTIVVRLRRPYAPFVSTFFSMAAFTYAVLPAHLLRGADLNHAAFNTMPVGTGPFRVVEYRHGDHLKLVANPAYWRGKPKLDEVIISYVGDQNTLVTQLRTHEIDFATNLSLSRVPDLAGIDGIDVFGIPFTYYTYVGFNTEHPPLDDVRIRRALTLGTDRPAIIADVTHGFALAAEGDQPPFSWAHSPQRLQPAYDPLAAGQLLDAAGWRMDKDGVRRFRGRPLELVVASTAGSTSYRDVEEIMQQEWRRLGVVLVVKNAPDSVLYAPAADGGVLASGAFDVMVQGWFNGVDPDDSGTFSCADRAPAGDDYTRLCDPRIDAAERRALSTYDPAERARDYVLIQRQIAQDRPMIFLWYAKRVDAANVDLRGYRPAHAVTTLWNTWDWSI